MPLRLEIVTAERVLFSDDVDYVSAYAADGRMGILPRHEATLTILLPGELHYTKDGVITPFAISGGFMEVLPDRVTVLADTAERADEIDEARAEASRQQAQEAMKNRQSVEDVALAELALRRAMVRLNVARLRRSRNQ